MTQRPDEREVREMLAVLRAEHRDLDERIVRLEAEQSNDQVTIKRLKKQKLLLKDRMEDIVRRYAAPPSSGPSQNFAHA